MSSTSRRGREAEHRVFQYLERHGGTAYRPPQRGGTPAADIIWQGLAIEVKAHRSYLAIIPSALAQVSNASPDHPGAVVTLAPGTRDIGDAVAAMTLRGFADLMAGMQEAGNYRSPPKGDHPS